MKQRDSFIQPIDNRRRPRGRHFVPLIAFASLALPARAHASLFHGETLDTIANVISWVAIVIAPIIGDGGKDPCPDCTDGVVLT